CLAEPAVLELKILQALHLLALQPAKLLAPPIIVTSLTPISRIASTMFWPCETRTSTCRSFATISSGLYRFLAIAVLLDVKDIPQVGPLQWGWINNDRSIGTCFCTIQRTTQHHAQPPLVCNGCQMREINGELKPRTVYEKAVQDFTETAQQLARLNQRFRGASFAEFEMLMGLDDEALKRYGLPKPMVERALIKVYETVV